MLLCSVARLKYEKSLVGKHSVKLVFKSKLVEKKNEKRKEVTLWSPFRRARGPQVSALRDGEEVISLKHQLNHVDTRWRQSI